MRQVAADRAEEVRFGRYLANDRVTLATIIADWSEATREAVRERHVLAIQDTSEINFKTTAANRRALGKIGRGAGFGALLHPMLACDAEDLSWLGLVNGALWTREGDVTTPRAKRPLGEKESARWVTTAQAAKPILAAARQVTFVSDRESDFFDLWAMVPETRFDLIVRARHDRVLADGGKLSTLIAPWPVSDIRVIDLPGRSTFEPQRQATLRLRFGTIQLARPANHIDNSLPETIALTLVEVEETDPPDGQDPVRWALLTTHRLDTPEAAWQIVAWYKARWAIEQLFRVLKTQGLNIEDSQVHDAPRLLKLIALATHAACVSMQLVQGRQDTARPATSAFSAHEIAVLRELSERRLRGRTPKQQNPHPKSSLAHAAWVIARLGGWKGYASERPPGHITMARGLERFKLIVIGHTLASTNTGHDLCIP